MKRRLAILALIVVTLAWGGTPPALHASSVSPTDSTVVTDSLYAAHHPCLLFKPADIPALQAKVIDGGGDDIALLFIEAVIDVVYLQSTMEEILGFGEVNELPDFGLESIPNLGIGAYVSSPPVAFAEALGRVTTNHLAANWDVDDDIYASSLRLRSLCLGYDLFFGNASEQERGAIRDEILAYLGFMRYKGQYQVWELRPYLSNKTAMMAASMGLASIVLQGEADQVLLDTGIDYADQLIDRLLNHQWDPEGAAREGVLYGAWSLRNLVYYFEARRRFDGYDYAQIPVLRNMERWLAYELDPASPGRVNNIQDCTSLDYPLARHTTYLDWAQARWGSRLAAYVWEQTASYPLGYDVGDHADKVGTVLWGGSASPENPTGILPASVFWAKRGLYYFRSGWPVGVVSDDVVFSLYAGQFEGGHQQEDQGQFTLTAYGRRFALDHGPGGVAKDTDAHNLVLIDGNGQHHAGSAIGTDAKMTGYLLGEQADLLVCDLADAYTTYSPLNSANTPFMGADWSWGYLDANPVEQATRTLLAIHAADSEPYFLIMDELDKDDQTHEYAWRIHVEEDFDVDATQNPLTLTAPEAAMDLHVLHPRFSNVATSVSAFDNQGLDPNSQVISVVTNAERARFSILMMPRSTSTTKPQVTQSTTVDGQSIATVVWPNGMMDIILVNLDGNPITASAGLLPATTDARVAWLRFEGAALVGFVLNDVTHLSVGTTSYVTMHNGTVNISWFDDRIRLDRHNADFVIYGPAVNDILYREQPISFFEHDGYLTPNLVTGTPDTPPAVTRLSVSTYPNPSTPTANVFIAPSRPSMVAVDIYNARGQHVERLFEGRVSTSGRLLAWQGTSADGSAVASGVYFVRVRADGHVRTAKLTLVR